MPTHADYASAIPDVLGRFGYWPIGDPRPVPGGTLNWNFRAGSDGGDWFVRRYRDDLETSRILGEHQLVRWAEERGVPAPVPERTPDDTTVVHMLGGRWAVYPWIEGETRPRGTLDTEAARTLGALHGYTQAVLSSHPDSAEATLSMKWDKGESVLLLDRIIAAAMEQDAEDWVLAGLRKQAAMLDALDVLPPSAFSSLPAQILHGDFHDQQVIWQGSNIAALVDWEVWRTDPRVWELVRSMAFSLILESPNLEPYLEGYRAFMRLSEEECRLGLRLWWQSRLVGVWAWAAHFLQGNERVGAFFPAMVAELKRLDTPGYTQRIEERFVAAALA